MGSPLEDLLADLLERRERGEPLELEALVRAHPAREGELRAALAGLDALERRLEQVGAARPTRIGRYLVQGELARGGMGRVLRALDPEHPEQPVALKLLDGVAGFDLRSRERFRREAALLRSLSHPGVVRVLEDGADEAVPWIAMELVEGESLAALVARMRGAKAGCSAPGGLFDPRHAAALAAQLARALEAVHGAGILHRDVKPANVILRPDGRLVLVDFGLVREEGVGTLTRTGDLLGTPQYMAPEQARGERADERTDVYGVGAVLFELCTLRAPHEGARSGKAGTSDPLHVLAQVRARSAPRLRALAPRIPRELERIAARALAFRRARRTPSASALARDLEAFLAGDAVEARPPSVLERLDEAWRAQRAKLPLATACVLVVAALLFGLRAWREQAARRERHLVEESLARFVAKDERGAESAARALLEQAPEQPFGPFLLALARDEEPPPSAEPAVAAVARGWSAERAGRHEEALLALQEARALAPEDPVPLVLLAREAELAEQLELAAREYRAAVERMPERPELFARLSAVHWARRDEAEAERAIRRAIELAPEDGSHRFALARILGRGEDKREALAAAELGAELAGDSATRLELQILSAMLDQAGRHEEARAVIRRVLAEHPGDPQALYNLAYSQMADHRLVEAVATCQELARTRDRSKALGSLAWIHAGSDRESCAQCRAAYAADPELLDPERAEQLALEALALNDSDEVVMLAARIGGLLGRRERIGALLQQLQAREEDDRRIARFERALRLLRQ